MKFNEQKKLYRQNALMQSDIRYLPDSRGLDVIQVPVECAETICHIHNAMERLAPMGDDDRRSLWFEVKGKSKRWEWYRLSVSTYKDCHYLYTIGSIMPCMADEIYEDEFMVEDTEEMPSLFFMLQAGNKVGVLTDFGSFRLIRNDRKRALRANWWCPDGKE